ncbi:hypothetical protein [Bradyrhizobium sp. 23]|uniref:hypothetical protein n=1 Tax=Bradyrhizobium sp. 23 TaxID=2782667 RepID=UPI001FFA1777|nr:hypothetical protein [Bradyrhizobium sp. 23]MCK1314982.1 hypothetical protein [Bradyrhizobium sp. 23]
MYNRIAVLSQRLEALASELSELQHLHELVLEAEQRLGRISFARTSEATKPADIAARHHRISDSGQGAAGTHWSLGDA